MLFTQNADFSFLSLSPGMKLRSSPRQSREVRVYPE